MKISLFQLVCFISLDRKKSTRGGSCWQSWRRHSRSNCHLLPRPERSVPLALRDIWVHMRMPCSAPKCRTTGVLRSVRGCTQAVEASITLEGLRKGMHTRSHLTFLLYSVANHIRTVALALTQGTLQLIFINGNKYTTLNY